MKKLYSLIKANMTSGMSLFKIKKKKNSKSSIYFPMFIALYLMFMIWGSANSVFEKLEPMNLQHVILSFFIFSISIMTMIEGIYKAGPLIFNCKDDQLLLSLPIKKSTIFLIRIFKFYIFELLFNSMFLLPIMIAYIRWGQNIGGTYFLTCFITLLVIPIIPIVLSCIVGVLISDISSRFKYKNAAQIIVSMIFLIGIMYLSFNMDEIFNYLIKHATSMNDFITKIYYPAGTFAKLVTDFNILDLIKFLVINISIFIISISILSKFYFKINSRLKSITTTHHKKENIDNLVIKQNSQIKSLIKKELNTFFKIPVFIINAGFALVLFIIATIVISIKFNSIIPILTSEQSGLNISKELIMNHIPIFIFLLILITSYTTSITNSVISLEGKNINILKSLPINSKTILISKVLAALMITTPVLLIGNIILIIRFKVTIIESFLLLILSILVPLISHFIGIIVNLKYPNFNWENSTEVVKQSTSSFISVIIGMLLLMISVVIVINSMENVSTRVLLLVATLFYAIVDSILYLYIIHKGVKKFNNLTV